MAHASVINNTLLNDDGQEIVAPLFRHFDGEIETLMSQRTRIPEGWRKHFDEAMKSLRAVDCPNRYTFGFSEAISVKGSLHVQLYSADGDRVVQGILNKLAARTACTCEVCGRRYGAAFRNQLNQTLCSVCFAKKHLDVCLDLWLGKDYKSRECRDRPLIEFVSLPINLRMLIPKSKVRCLKLVSDNKVIDYVTPDIVLKQKSHLELMKRYLQKVDADHAYEAA